MMKGRGPNLRSGTNLLRVWDVNVNSKLTVLQLTQQRDDAQLLPDHVRVEVKQSIHKPRGRFFAD